MNKNLITEARELATENISQPTVFYKDKSQRIMLRLCDALEKAGAQMPRWIPVSERLPENEPLTCEGCVDKGQYENEVEYGYPSPCTRCKRRSPDNYRRKPEVYIGVDLASGQDFTFCAGKPERSEG